MILTTIDSTLIQRKKSQPQMQRLHISLLKIVMIYTTLKLSQDTAEDIKKQILMLLNLTLQSIKEQLNHLQMMFTVQIVTLIKLILMLDSTLLEHLEAVQVHLPMFYYLKHMEVIKKLMQHIQKLNISFLISLQVFLV